MPRYEYSCDSGHRWDEFHPMSRVSGRHICPSCKRRGRQVYAAPGLSGVGMNSKELEMLKTPLGRKNMHGVKTAKDVDRVLQRIQSNYPWMGGIEKLRP